MTKSTLCLFAKPPRPGEVKTRLAQSLGARAAAELADAFLRDSWALVTTVEWAEPVLATTSKTWGSDLAHLRNILFQGDGDLGNRLERVLRVALERTETAFAMGADTPGLPPELLDLARVALDEHDAVLGPCEDGGFYLIGLRACPAGLLADLPWSAPTTFQQTLRRLRDRGLATAVLPPWFDVDNARDLVCLEELLELGELSAPRTASWLREHRVTAPGRGL